MRMHRTGKRKLIRDFLNPERDELYDLVADPAETKNLIASTDPRIQQAKEQLHAKILEKMKANKDTVATR